MCPRGGEDRRTHSRRGQTTGCIPTTSQAWQLLPGTCVGDQSHHGPWAGTCMADHETIPCRSQQWQVFWVSGFLSTHMWHIQPRSSAWLTLRLGVQEKGAVTAKREAEAKPAAGLGPAVWLCKASLAWSATGLQLLLLAHHGGSLTTALILRATGLTPLGLQRHLLLALLQVFYHPNSILFCWLK